MCQLYKNKLIKITHAKSAGREAHVVECPPSKYKALSLTPNTAKKKPIK
jgi:hypothetical protein